MTATGLNQIVDFVARHARELYSRIAVAAAARPREPAGSQDPG
jgi:hypothetical protein